MAYLVRLKGNWPGNFRRSVRRDAESGEQVLSGGEIIGVLEFSPGKEVALTEEEFRAVSADIGVCLEHVNLDEKNRPRLSEEPVEVSDDLLPNNPPPDEEEPIAVAPKAAPKVTPPAKEEGKVPDDKAKAAPKK